MTDKDKSTPLVLWITQNILSECYDLMEKIVHNIYLLEQDINFDWDHYDSCVVVADSEEEARHIHPGQIIIQEWWNVDELNDDWCLPEDVRVRHIGTTTTLEPGTVICASFNAG